MDEVIEKIITIFTDISSVPRCSGNEERIAMWLKEWALCHGFSVKFDSVNNIVIGIPASKGYEDLLPVVIQGHMDMVCEKTQASEHDFSTDPIIPIFDGEWLRAQDTTLGADNGIGIALALAVAEDKSSEHPPLELLFTVDEETGLTGANALTPDFITGKILLNVDSEDEGVFIVGCAGGLNTTIGLPLEFSTLPDDTIFFKLVVDGLSGGHSGIDIDEKRANAIKMLAATLQSLSHETDVRLVDLKGGSAHNAIPRYAEALVAFSGRSRKRAISIISDLEDKARSEYSDLEPSLSITLKSIEEISGSKALDETLSEKVFSLLSSLPHGVVSMSRETPGLVETSSNLATVSMNAERLTVLTSQRSSSDPALKNITEKITSISKDFGANCSYGSGYPAWQPDMDSPLLQQCREIYSDVFGQNPEIEVIHAGLECAVIGSKYDGMDMISFGPTIKNPHSPDERLHIPSVRKVWDFMIPLLSSFDDKSKFRGSSKKT